MSAAGEQMAKERTAPAEQGECAVVRATRMLREGRWQWLGLIASPAEAAGQLDPQPTAAELVQAAEYQLAACGVRGAAQITLFLEL